MLKHICFAGGGFKGWTYIGTLRSLKELIDFKNIEQVVGVSVGSLFGLFYVLQFDYREILDFIINLNYSELLDINLDYLISNESIIQGKKYTELLKELITRKVDPDLTFKQLYIHNGINYTVGAFNITESKMEYFNYQNNPDVKIIESIIASCSIPLLFPPVKINDCFYYDGALCNNCPVDILPELSTIAFDLDMSFKDGNSSSKVFEVINSLSTIINNTHKKESHIGLVHQLLDSRFNNELLNFNQTKDDIFNLYMHGYINSKKILFETFKAIKN